jgi:hypothetical protein
MFYYVLRANLISKTVESSKLMMSHVILVAYVMTYRIKIYRLNHVVVSHMVPCLMAYMMTLGSMMVMVMMPLMPPMKFSWFSHIYPSFSTSPSKLGWINKAV